MVRTKMSSLERKYSIGFVVDEDKIEKLGLKGHAKDKEIRIEKWDFILEKSEHPEVKFFRLIVLLHLFMDDPTKIRYCKQIRSPRTYFKSLKHKFGYDYYLKFGHCVSEYLKKKLS